MNKRLPILCTALLLVTGVSRAADFHVAGYGDVRLVVPPATDAYLDGGLGKLRFGEDDANPGFKLGDLVAEATLQGEAWSAQADARLNTEYGPAVDLLEGFVRYAPAANTQWRWSARAGAFFPGLSLENEQVGWSTFWTVTPSAIDSWVGSELRTVGAEGTVEWHGNGNDVTLNGALFGFDDSAGVLIAERGWNFDDRAAGLFEASRLPDAVATAAHRAPPLDVHLFREIDDTPGWYLDLSYELDGTTGVEVMRYDNEADPTRPRAWHTAFWDIGLRRQLGAVTILAQAMHGDTRICPSATSFTATNFDSAYILAGWDLDDWQLAARADVFQTRTQTAAPTLSPLSEDGHAFDVTASWLPRRWLRLSAEYLLVDDTRAQRLIDGDAAHQTGAQFQLVLRTYF